MNESNKSSTLPPPPKKRQDIQEQIYDVDVKPDRCKSIIVHGKLILPMFSAYDELEIVDETETQKRDHGEVDHQLQDLGSECELIDSEATRCVS